MFEYSSGPRGVGCDSCATRYGPGLPGVPRMAAVKVEVAPFSPYQQKVLVANMAQTTRKINGGNIKYIQGGWSGVL